MRACRIALPVLLAFCTGVRAQPSTADLQRVMDRLDKLERENAELREDVRKLRERVGEPVSAEAAPPIEERLAVQERRIEEQQQTKVESSQKAPVRLTGMVLANTYWVGPHGIGIDTPIIAYTGRQPRVLRGSFHQSMFGLEVESPYPVLGAQARGSVVTDFFAYGQDTTYAYPRLRTATAELNWATRSIRFAIDKPIVSQRNPFSLAQVGYPALSAAGNLWAWQPQLRLEQRFGSAKGTQFRAQAGVFQTYETNLGAAAGLLSSERYARPGWQGRIEVRRSFEGGARFEFAPGVHYSRTLAGGASAPSRLFTMDGVFSPTPAVELTGFFYTGMNTAPLGGLRQGVVILPDNTLRAVGATGGWAQLALRPADRWRIHLMAGEEDARNRDLGASGIDRNLSYAANVVFNVSPQILISVEAQQIRTQYITRGLRLLNRYDLALAYLF